MKKKEHRALFSRFKPGLGKWLCFLCALLFPFFVFASNKGLVGYWPLSERSEALGSELMNSPSAETGITKLNNYYSSIRSTDERSTEQSHSGSYSMKIITETNDGNGTYFQMGNYGNMNGLEIGKTYEFSVWVYIPSGQGITLSNVYMAGAGACTTNTATENDIWQRLSCSKTITTGATEVYTRYFIGGYPTAGIYAYWDDFSIKEITTADATPNNNNGSVLNGPAYTAGRDGKGLGEELVTNGEFDTNTTGWTAYNSSSLSVDTQQLKVTNTDALYGTAYQVISVVPGKKYRYSVTNKGGTNTQRIMFVGPAVYNNTLGQVTVAENGRGYIDFTAATSTIYIHVRNDNVSGNYGLWDDFSVREISSGQAMSFDGVDDYVDLGSSSELDNIGENITVSAWVKTNVNSGGQTIVGRGNDWQLEKSGSSYRFEHRNINQNIVVATAVNTTAEWIHVAGTYANNTFVKLYINGVLVDSKAQTLSTRISQGQNQIGNNYAWHSDGTYNDYYFNGSISDVRIYDRALSAAEIEQLYSGSGESTASTGSLNKGLVGHWPLNTESKKSATVVADTTPHSNNGTLSGAIVRNNGYSFDGVSNYIDAGADANLDLGTGSASISAWFRTTNAGGNAIVTKRKESGFQLYVHNTKLYADGGGTAGVHSSAVVNDGLWHHGVAVYDRGGSLLRLYLDGVADGTVVLGSTTLTDTGDLNIGRATLNVAEGRDWFDGNIADVRIYDRALSVTEVSNLYNGSDIPGAIGHWPLSSGPGDVSGNGNNGTVSGATLIGEAASFDGVDDTIIVSHDSVLNFAKEDTFSVGFWLNINALPTGDVGLLDKGGYGSDFRIRLYSNGSIQTQSSNGTDGIQPYSFSTTTPLSADKTWHNVVLVYGGSTNKRYWYIDGIPSGSEDTTGAYINGTSNLIFGRGGSAEYFDGSLKDIRIYDRPLSATEVATLYDQGHGKPKQATIGNLNKGLVGHWPLSRKYTKDETMGSEIMADVTPYGNDGQNYGATVASGYTAFDGVDNEVAVSDISFSQNEDWSFSMWQYKPTGSASSWQGFIGAQLGSSGGVNGGYWMWHPQLMWYQDYYDDGGGAHSWGYLSSSVNLGDEVPYDEWFHLTVTYNASNYEVKAYINGILEETKTISWSSRPVTNFTVRTIGEGDSSRYFEGSIADTRVYNRVLSDREVKMLYDKGR